MDKLNLELIVGWQFVLIMDQSGRAAGAGLIYLSQCLVFRRWMWWLVCSPWGCGADGINAPAGDSHRGNLDPRCELPGRPETTLCRALDILGHVIDAPGLSTRPAGTLDWYSLSLCCTQQHKLHVDDELGGRYSQSNLMDSLFNWFMQNSIA